MKLAIMQPYFLPYLGYFQLISAADEFVVYDNIEYTKKGWINRNRLLRDGEPVTFSLPLKKASDYLDVRGRELAEDFRPDKLLNQIKGVYQKAPFFQQTFELLERIVRCEERNLFRYLHESILALCGHLGITSKIRISSEINADHSLHNQDKVIALCRALGARVYINAIGGLELYSRADFTAQSIDLKFIRSASFEYEQAGRPFIPNLSIIDVLMFNPIDKVRSQVSAGYELI